jgi:hypothetical protein
MAIGFIFLDDTAGCGRRERIRDLDRTIEVLELMAWFRKDDSHPFEVVTEVDGGVDDRHACGTLEEAEGYYRTMRSQVLRKWTEGDFITFEVSLVNRKNNEILECDDETQHEEDAKGPS